MSAVECGECTQCCRWGDTVSIRPMLTKVEAHNFANVKLDGHVYLKSDKEGNCIYLGDGGCTIHDRRPHACRAFDCRALYTDIAKHTNTTFIKVLVEGKRRV